MLVPAHSPERRRINEVQMPPHKFGKRTLRAGLCVFLQQCSIAPHGSLPYSTRRSENRTNLDPYIPQCSSLRLSFLSVSPVSIFRLLPPRPADAKRNAALDSSATDKFPPGLNNAFLFATFNALSFQIILGSPMVLYAKSLGASATVLGIITGMLPLLVIFQIPAANYIGRIGYKKFVYAGWGSRVIFIFAIALIPGMTFLKAETKLSLILFLLFIFNLLRGISSCAWLPWISSRSE